jgi:hypothetical protein
MTPPEIANGGVGRQADRDHINAHEAQWRQFCQVPIFTVTGIDRARDS